MEGLGKGQKEKRKRLPCGNSAEENSSEMTGQKDESKPTSNGDVKA